MMSSRTGSACGCKSDTSVRVSMDTMVRVVGTAHLGFSNMSLEREGNQ